MSRLLRQTGQDPRARKGGRSPAGLRTERQGRGYRVCGSWYWQRGPIPSGDRRLVVCWSGGRTKMRGVLVPPLRACSSRSKRGC